MPLLVLRRGVGGMYKSGRGEAGILDREFAGNHSKTITIQFSCYSVHSV